MKEYLPAIKQLRTDIADTRKSELLATIASKDIIVVKGEYDRVEDILEEMQINHTMFNYGISRSANLYPNQTVLVNCPGANICIPVVSDFVKSGGWLVTTDWALEKVIEEAFPRTIYKSGKTFDDVVEISPCESQITKGMPDKSQFWLEGSSHLIGIKDANNTLDTSNDTPSSSNGNRIKILIKSNELSQKYGKSNIVMVGFNWGKGKVFHSISHFILQKSKSGKTRLQDAYSSLVLLTNILAQKKANQER